MWQLLPFRSVIGTPILQYSDTPILRYSNTPILRIGSSLILTLIFLFAVQIFHRHVFRCLHISVYPWKCLAKFFFLYSDALNSCIISAQDTPEQAPPSSQLRLHPLQEATTHLQLRWAAAHRHGDLGPREGGSRLPATAGRGGAAAHHPAVSDGQVRVCRDGGRGRGLNRGHVGEKTNGYSTTSSTENVFVGCTIKSPASLFSHCLLRSNFPTKPYGDLQLSGL